MASRRLFDGAAAELGLLPVVGASALASGAYWIVHPDSTWPGTPTGAQIAAGKLSDNSAAAYAGSETAPTSGSGTITEATAVTGLTALTAYRIAWVVYDAGSDTYSNVVVGSETTTAATLALSASPLEIAGTLATAGELDYLLSSLALSASPLALSGSLSTTGDLTITPAATLALSASPLAIAGTLATAGELDYLLPALALSASPLAITGTLATTGDLAYELPTLALSASPLALSGTLTPSGDIDYQLPFALTASALAVSGTLSVSGDLSITDQIRLTLSASPLALAGALAVAGDLDYVVPTLVLSASPLALSGSVAVTGDLAAVVPFVLSASPITLTGAVSISGDVESSDEPLAPSGIDIEYEFEPALWWQRKPKTLGNVKAKAKLAKVAKVIAKKAVEQVEKSAPENQRKAEVRQAVAPMLAEMPGFDWKPVYDQAYSMALTAAIDAQMRQAEANQAAAREIERIRQLDEEDIAILVAMM